MYDGGNNNRDLFYMVNLLFPLQLVDPRHSGTISKRDNVATPGEKQETSVLNTNTNADESAKEYNAMGSMANHLGVWYCRVSRPCADVSIDG